MIFGAHCSGGIKKSIDRATEIGADSLQLFVQSPRAWRFPDHDPADLAAFRDRRDEAELGGVLVHCLYLVNLATPNDDFYEKSVYTMLRTVETSAAIEADGVVLHVGSHLGAGFDAGMERVVPALEQILERTSDTTWLLMENTAGAGGTIGRSVDELEAIFERLGRHRRLGICLDSCHLYASGTDVTDRGQLDRLLDEIDSTFGLDRVRALHVERLEDAARLEPRPARQHPRRRDGREARRLPRPPRPAGPPGRPRGPRPGRPRPRRGRGHEAPRAARPSGLTRGKRPVSPRPPSLVAAFPAA